METLLGNGYELVDIGEGHWITPDGREIEHCTREHLHERYVEDTGLLDGAVDDYSMQEIVNALMRHGWIRQRGWRVWEVWELNSRVLKLLAPRLDLYADLGYRSLTINVVAEGKEYRFEAAQYKDAGFDLKKTLARAEVIDRSDYLPKDCAPLKVAA